MAGIVVIAVIILVGAYFLVRTPPPPPRQALPDADALLLRDAVLEKLRERLVGWAFETSAERPLEVVAIESGSERRIVLDLTQLALGWHPLHQRGAKEEADDLVEAFVHGATGESGSTEAALDTAWIEGALAVQLAATAPAGSIARAAGPLQAVLVLRNPEGPAPVTTEDLAEWNLSAERAFAIAQENLAGDVAEGLHVEPIGDAPAAPDALDLAPGDPLAASYALVPRLDEALSKRLGGKPVRLHLLAPGRLVAAPDGAPLPHGLDVADSLLPGGTPPGALRLG